MSIINCDEITYIIQGKKGHRKMTDIIPSIINDQGKYEIITQYTTIITTTFIEIISTVVVNIKTIEIKSKENNKGIYTIINKYGLIYA